MYVKVNLVAHHLKLSDSVMHIIHNPKNNPCKDYLLRKSTSADYLQIILIVAPLP